MTVRFLAEVEIRVPNDLHQYINRPKTKISQSLLNELAKEQVAEDLKEALRTYGIQGVVVFVSKVQP